MTETKNQKFLRLSGARVDKVIFAMSQLHHLTSHHYEYSIEEVEQIISKLHAATNMVAEAFGHQSVPEPKQRPEPEYIVHQAMNGEETLINIKVGPQIGEAINAISDQDPAEAKCILLNLMRS